MLSGRAGVGKSTSANILVDSLTNLGYSVIVSPFAAGVKHAAKIGFGWDGKKDAKGRRLLQGVGAVGRDYDPDIWVADALHHVAIQGGFPYDFVLVDDWRFPNEYDYISKINLYSTYKIRIDAPSRELLVGTELYNDVSETSLPVSGDYYDFIVRNEGSVDLLRVNLSRLIGNILEKELIYAKE